MNETINSILLGGLLGIIGQGIRTIVGIKKMKDTRAQNKINAASAESTNANNIAANNGIAPVTAPVIPGGDYDGRRLGMSLFIGFIAGALGALFAVDLKNAAEYKTALATLIAIGYSGVDFIEGMITKLGVDKNNGS